MMSIKPNSHLRPISQEMNEREIWYKLVVKILRWKDGFKEFSPIKQLNKITSKEWNTYCKHVIKTNISYDRKKVLDDLKGIKKLIEGNNGFE